MCDFIVPSCRLVSVQDGMTPLHCACYCGNVELVRDMLTAGADATIRCKVCSWLYSAGVQVLK